MILPRGHMGLEALTSLDIVILSIRNPDPVQSRDLHGTGKLTHSHPLPRHFLSIPVRPPVQIQNSGVTNTFPAIIIKIKCDFNNG